MTDPSTLFVTDRDRWRDDGSVALFPLPERALAAHLRGALSAEEAASLADAVLAAREHFTSDFGGEQWSLGRAFYTHLETGKSALYFAKAAESDALVERTLPGMQSRMRSLLAAMLGASVRARRGFCGPGVHIFPAGEKVAREGGVVHYDTEGLTALQLRQRARAVTLVVMLRPAERGGGLRLWPARYRGFDHGTDEELADRSLVLSYAPGDAALIDSYTLHQIEGFDGSRDRVSLTAHAVEVDRGQWECWF